MTDGKICDMPIREYDVCMLLADETEDLLGIVGKPLAKQHLVEAWKYLRWAAADLKQCNGVVA